MATATLVHRSDLLAAELTADLPAGLGPFEAIGFHDGFTLGQTDPGPLHRPLPDGVKATRVAAGDGETTTGGDGDDTIVGDPSGPLFDKDAEAPAAYDDVILGGGGDDTILGGAGADSLFGEGGDDWIRGEAGADVIDGGADDDVLFGGGGDDSVYGGAGADKLSGGEGNDFLTGGWGLDTVHGGDGDDVVLGGIDLEADMIMGAEGNDTVAGRGNDLLYGGNGADRFEGLNTAGLIARAMDYSFAEGDEVRGDHFEVTIDGDTLVFDPEGTLLLVIDSYNAYDDGIAFYGQFL